jgi:hypothetical protein
MCRIRVRLPASKFVQYFLKRTLWSYPFFATKFSINTSLFMENYFIFQEYSLLDNIRMNSTMKKDQEILSLVLLQFVSSLSALRSIIHFSS